MTIQLDVTIYEHRLLSGLLDQEIRSLRGYMDRHGYSQGLADQVAEYEALRERVDRADAEHPPRCAGCGRTVAMPGAVCSECAA